MEPKYNFIIILFTVLSNSSCRSNKESSYTQSRYETLVQGQTFQHWHHYDSTLRYWYYQSDSAFYFHPDSGLYASSGWLAVGEQSSKYNFGQVSRDSSFYLHSQQSAEQEKSVTKDRSRRWVYVLGIGIVLVLGVGFYFGKRTLSQG